MTSLELVKNFHEVFGHPILHSPNIANTDLNKLRVDLLTEELFELRLALLAGDVVETLDALSDLQYVLDGAYLSFGLHQFKDAAIQEVHRSNMSKLDESGQPIMREDGKFLKGPNYIPPDLGKVLAAE